MVFDIESFLEEFIRLSDCSTVRLFKHDELGGFASKRQKRKLSYFTERLRDYTEPHGEEFIEDAEAAAPLGYYKSLSPQKTQKGKSAISQRGSETAQRYTEKSIVRTQRRLCRWIAIDVFNHKRENQLFHRDSQRRHRATRRKVY